MLIPLAVDICRTIDPEAAVSSSRRSTGCSI